MFNSMCYCLTKMYSSLCCQAAERISVIPFSELNYTAILNKIIKIKNVMSSNEWTLKALHALFE